MWGSASRELVIKMKNEVARRECGEWDYKNRVWVVRKELEHSGPGGDRTKIDFLAQSKPLLPQK